MAYEFSKLTDKLKEKGLDIAEGAAQEISDAVLEWLVESAIESPNKIDDIIAVIIPLIKSELDKLIDTIDGEVDNPAE